MIVYLISFLLLWQTTEVPLRAKEDFHVELKYNMKQKPQVDHTKVVMDGGRVIDRLGGGNLPYLIVKVTILNHKPEELRFKCEDNTGHSMFNIKAAKSLEYTIDMGYIDDLKDHTSPYSFTVYALSEDKVQLNKVVLFVQDDGTFLVNNEKRGKF